jgi:hypothetical protein
MTDAYATADAILAEHFGDGICPSLLPSGALSPIHQSVAFILGGVTFIIWEEE